MAGISLAFLLGISDVTGYFLSFSVDYRADLGKGPGALIIGPLATSPATSDFAASYLCVCVCVCVCVCKPYGDPVVKNLFANAGAEGLIPELERSPGEGNGNPLQYSCLGNPMDGGPWWATVHGATKSWT